MGFGDPGGSSALPCGDDPSLAGPWTPCQLGVGRNPDLSPRYQRKVEFRSTACRGVSQPHRAATDGAADRPSPARPTARPHRADGDEAAASRHEKKKGTRRVTKHHQTTRFDIKTARAGRKPKAGQQTEGGEEPHKEPRRPLRV
nr:MAG TPA: hypothetical protein [Caudoviricetes sp.]